MQPKRNRGTQVTDQQTFTDAVLAVTGGENWEVIQQGLRNMIYEVQASALELKSWEEVNQAKGFAQGLNYVIHLRDMELNKQEQDNAPV